MAKITKKKLEELQQERDHAQVELNHLRSDLSAEFEHDDLDDAAAEIGRAHV